MTDRYMEKYTERPLGTSLKISMEKNKTTFLCNACDMERMGFVATPTSAFGSLEMTFHQVSDYSPNPFLFHDLSTPYRGKFGIDNYENTELKAKILFF